MRIAVAGGTGTVGHHVVAHAQQAGHQAVALSRSRGVDLRSGEGLAGALNGADAVIDVTHPDTIEQGGGDGILDRCRGRSAAHRRRTGREAYRDAVDRGDREDVIRLLCGQAGTRARRSQRPGAGHAAAGHPVPRAARATDRHHPPRLPSARAGHAAGPNCLEPDRFRRQSPKWHYGLRGENRKWDKPGRSTPRNIRTRLSSW